MVYNTATIMGMHLYEKVNAEPDVAFARKWFLCE